MCEKCSEELKVLRQSKYSNWEDIFVSCRAIFNCSKCREKYDREIMKGLEFCFDNGLTLDKYPSDTLVAYRIILEKYLKYGGISSKKTEVILDKISKHKDIPEWYWFFKTKFAYNSAKRLLNRKIKNLQANFEEYYLNEGQRPKNLCLKFADFLESVDKSDTKKIDYVMSEDMELAKQIRDIYNEYKKEYYSEAKIKNVVYENEVEVGNKKIFIIGDSKVNNAAIVSKIKEVGYKEDSVEMIVNYEDIKRFDFNKLKDSGKFEVIILGPVPHQVIGINGYESIQQRMRVERGFPCLIELEKHDPISLNSLEIALRQAKNIFCLN